MRKVIFLDIDGVLNNLKSMKMKSEIAVDPETVLTLNRIVKSTGAEVILSSVWRWDQESVDYLKSVGVPIDGCTARSGDLSGPRSRRIERWLDENSADRFVILDDDDDVGGVPGGLFIHVDYNPGLTPAEGDDAITELNRS